MIIFVHISSYVYTNAYLQMCAIQMCIRIVIYRAEYAAPLCMHAILCVMCIRVYILGGYDV